MYNKYVIDEMVKIHNKDILRLPPYHCELAWSSIKNNVRQNNTTFKLHDVKQLFIEGVERVDSAMWKNFIGHVIEEKDKLWNMDFVVDELTAEQEPCVLNLGPDDSDSESDLDSDDDVRPLSDE